MTDAFGPIYDSLPVPPPLDEPAPVSAPVAIKAARAKLNPTRSPQSAWPLLGAAALCAGAALALASVVILGPPMAKPERAGPVTVAAPG